jgi:hypothetical protein
MTRHFTPTWKHGTLAVLVTTTALLAGASPVHGQTTELSEVVMYGIDADTNELLRYSFETDDFIRIGAIKTSDKKNADDCENLAWVPSGPARGMYVIPTKGDLRGWLLRVNPLDGSAERVRDTGLRHAIGMCTVQDPGNGNWMIITSDRNDDPTLHAIDPRTGNTMHILDTDQEYEGLTMTPDGRLLGNTTDGLWVIDPASGSETKLGDFAYDKVEALEYAFGDDAPTIDATDAGVPAAWTAQINPADGDAVDYDCTFSTVDCEGLVFTTKWSDPFGQVVADPHD